MQFEDLGLIEPLLRAVRAEGYTDPTPIQQQAIGHLLEGKDLLGCAQTGTGKTAAFALPILQRLQLSHPHPEVKPHRGKDGKETPEKAPEPHRPIRALIITPTRELAAQIDESFAAYGKFTSLRHTVIFGGVKQGSQAKALKKGVDILVATPGRLLDLMGQRLVKLAHVEILVLDEADRMLDMGFIQDIRRVVAELPAKRQTLLFSATMPSKIQYLADSILNNPVEVRIAKESSPEAETIDQSVYFVERTNKPALLEHLLADNKITRALVFTRTKFGADRLTRHLRKANIHAEAIHSNKSQNARQEALEMFKKGKTRVLVASDIAARGIDVDDISHVINYDMPNEAEVYVHRIGRTGRAGRGGVAWSFCGIEERCSLDDIERLIQKTIQAITEHPFPSPLPRAEKKKQQQAAAKKGMGGWRIPGRRRKL